jgi:hypothetical protein
MTRERQRRGRGGARAGAGRKPHQEKAGVSHLARPELNDRFPVHVTWRMREDVWDLGVRRCLSLLEAALLKSSNDRFRIVHYAVIGNYIHLLVEADDTRALSLGMQGLGIRIARGLNKVMDRPGRVLRDRFNAHILRTATETQNARQYLLENAGPHLGSPGVDGCASRAPLQEPRTELLRLAS